MIKEAPLHRPWQPEVLTSLCADATPNNLWTRFPLYGVEASSLPVLVMLWKEQKQYLTPN